MPSDPLAFPLSTVILLWCAELQLLGLDFDRALPRARTLARRMAPEAIAAKVIRFGKAALN